MNQKTATEQRADQLAAEGEQPVLYFDQKRSNEQDPNALMKLNDPVPASDPIHAEIARLSMFEISKQLVELYDFRDGEDLTTEERDVVEKEIAKYIAAHVQKVDNIRAYRNWCEAMLQAHKSESVRQHRMASAWEARIEHLDRHVINALDLLGKKSVQGKTGKLRIQNNGGVAPMEIFDEEKLPGQYRPMTVTYVPDKEEIRKALTEGKEIPGARLLKRGVHLRVE